MGDSAHPLDDAGGSRKQVVHRIADFTQRACIGHHRFLFEITIESHRLQDAPIRLLANVPVPAGNGMCGNFVRPLEDFQTFLTVTRLSQRVASSQELLDYTNANIPKCRLGVGGTSCKDNAHRDSGRR